MPDRQEWATATISAAVEAAEAGFGKKADDILRHAVHDGLRPTEIVFAALASDPVTVNADPWTEEALMLVTYIGPEDGVTLAPASGGLWMPKGQPVDLPDGVARSLCEQPDFTRAKARKRPGDAPKP